MLIIIFHSQITNHLHINIENGYWLIKMLVDWMTIIIIMVLCPYDTC